MTSDVAVIGGGIIGTASALALSRAGRAVTIFDPDGAGGGTAAGSAGIISPSEIFPMAHAALLRELPRMLADPLGPLAIRPEYLPRLTPWGLRFLRAMAPARHAAGTRALVELNRSANEALLDVAAAADAARLLDLRGGLIVAERTESLRELDALQAALAAHGVASERLTAPQLHEREPALSADLPGALFIPSAGRCLDPGGFGAALAGAAERLGARVVREPVTRITPERDGTWTVHARTAQRAKRVVVAAGVWSGDLLRPLGYRVPIETERGYHLMLPQSGVTMSFPVIFHERHFCATPMSHGLRLAGTVEFAGTKAPMNARRSDVLYELAQPALPGLRREGATRWMGFRPSFPDSIPALGASRAHAGLFYAFGHGHLGLTQSGTTALAIAALVAGGSPSIDLAPFSLARFGGCG